MKTLNVNKMIRNLALGALIAAGAVATQESQAAQVGSTLQGAWFYNGMLKNGNLNHMRNSDNMRATLGTSKLGKNNFRCDWYSQHHSFLQGTEDIVSIGIELEAQTTLPGTTDAFIWNNWYGEWVPAGKILFQTTDKTRHITFTDDYMWDYVNTNGDVYVAFGRGTTVTCDLKVDRVHVDITTDDFFWRLLEASPFIGEGAPRTAVYRSAAQLAAAKPGKNLGINWSTSMAAYISLSEAPSTNYKVNVLDVSNTGSEIVVNYETRVSGIGLYIFCDPGAYLEISKSDLPVRFVWNGYSYGP